MVKCETCGINYSLCDMCSTITHEGEAYSLSVEVNDYEYTHIGHWTLCRACWGGLHRTILDKYATTTAWVGAQRDAEGCPHSCTYRRGTPTSYEESVCWAQKKESCMLEETYNGNKAY